MGGTTDLTGTPAFLGTSSVSYSAKDVRRFMTSAPIIFTAGGEGIVESGDFAVAQRAAGANMSADVSGGEAYVKGDTNADEGSYYCRESSSTLNVTFTASDATNPRVDRVVLEVKNDSEDSSGLNKGRIRVIDGTPTSGATLTNLTGAAAVPNTCLLLANVLVPASATTVTTANIQDRRFGVPVAGRHLFGGYASTTADSGGAGDKQNITVIGDGTTAVEVGGRWMTSSSGTFPRIELRDGAGGTGSLYAKFESGAATGANFAGHVKIPAFSGSKTFYASLQNVSGTPSFFANAYGNAELEAKWWI